MSTNKINTPAISPLGNVFRYDQLNRIKSSNSFKNITIAATRNYWNTSGNIVNLYKNEFTYDPNGNILSQKTWDGATTPVNIDNLSYNYPRTATEYNNKLSKVTDASSAYAGFEDIEPGQLDNNYVYDKIGNLVVDVQEKISNITWLNSGKIKSIDMNTSATGVKKDLQYDYDAIGNRVAKHVFTPNGVYEYSLYYIRDAQGHVISTYKKLMNVSNVTTSLKQTERHLYGSNRLGTDIAELEMIGAITNTSGIYNHFLGQKVFEASNHLGNVLTTFTDKKIPRANLATSTKIDFWMPELYSATDYYPFGQAMPGRNFELTNASKYRYGFNGKENDNEVKGQGNQVDFDARILDPRLGRFLSLDPLATKYPSQSPYMAFANNPNIYVDKDGKENTIYLIALPDKSSSIKKFDAVKVRDLANQKLKDLGLNNLKVVIITPEQLDLSKLDKSDAISVIGNKESVTKFVSEKLDKEFAKTLPKMDVEESENVKDTKYSKKGGGKIIAINSSSLKGVAKTLKTTSDNLAAQSIVHGAGHNAGLNHSGSTDGTIMTDLGDVTEILGKQTNPDLKKLDDFAKPIANTLTGDRNRNEPYTKQMKDRFDGKAHNPRMLKK